VTKRITLARACGIGSPPETPFLRTSGPRSQFTKGRWRFSWLTDMNRPTTGNRRCSCCWCPRSNTSHRRWHWRGIWNSGTCNSDRRWPRTHRREDTLVDTLHLNTKCSQGYRWAAGDTQTNWQRTTYQYTCACD